MRRKMLVTSLILGSSSSFVSAQLVGETVTVSRSATVDLVLGTLHKALESGTVTDLTWDELNLIRSPIVTLVTPQVAVHAKELTFRYVKVHQIVVDAALEVLSLLGQQETEEKRKSMVSQQLLYVVFPAYDTGKKPWGWDLEVPIGWLEDSSGKKPLLSKAQAVSLVQTTDIRLVKTGLSVLSLECKLELCEGFGLSLIGTAALLEDLNSVKDVRMLESILGSFSRQRLEKLTSCVQTFLKADSKGAGSLLRILEQKSAPSAAGSFDIQQTTMFGVKKERTTFSKQSDVEKSASKRSVEEITEGVLRWLMSVEKVHSEWQTWDDLSSYVQLREDLQRALVLGSLERIKSVTSLILADLEKAGDGCLGGQRFLMYGLPVLILLSYAPCLKDKPKQPGFVFGKWQPSVERLTDMGLERRDTCYPAISAAALVVSKELQRNLIHTYKVLAGKSTGNSFQVPERLITGSSRRASSNNSATPEPLTIVAAGFNIPLDIVEKASSERFEAILRYFLRQKLQSLWIRTYTCDSKSLAPLFQDMLSLLRKWGSTKGYSESLPALSGRDTKSQIELSGRCGLVMELLTFLSPEFDAEGFLTAVVDMSGVQTKLQASNCPSLAAMGLSYVIHKSSWCTVSKVFQHLVGSDLTTEKREFAVEGSETSMEPLELRKGLEPVIEFILLCVQHPRAKLACRADVEFEPYKSSANLPWSWLNSTSARELTKISVSACVASKLGSVSDESRTVRPHVSIEQYVYAFDMRTQCPVSRAMKVLVLAGYQGPHIMRAVVQHLCSYEDITSSAGLVIKGSASPSVESSFKAVARSLLWGLYLTFPVSVKSILHSSYKKDILSQDARSHSEVNDYVQTCSLNRVIHSAIWTFCSGNEKESNAAYGFCQEFARHHPLLLLPYLPTLRILLKELLPLRKQGESQARMTATRALSMGLGLLDALRPHIILKNNSINNSDMPLEKYSGRSARSSEQAVSSLIKSDLDEILDLYFEILRDLEVQDGPHFAKLVARFADFMCHCVAAGGRSREYVSAKRTPVLETTARNFGKIKKIGFLLSLLDKPGSTPLVDDISASVLTSYSLPGGVNPQASLPIPLDQILTVRNQLQHCIKISAKEMWKGEGLAFYSTERSSRVSKNMGGDVEGNLSDTLSDVDKASARVPAILSVLEDSLVQLITVKDTPLRERIYALLERTLLHCPSETSASNILEGLLQQLTSSDVLRAKSAARNASRFFQFSTDLQETLLVEMLQLGRIASDDLQQLVQGLFSIAGSHSG